MKQVQLWVQSAKGQDLQAIEAEVGQSLADALAASGLIEARCGGALACATCAVSLEAAGWSPEDRLPASEEEAELLDLFVEAAVGAACRLSCQLLVQTRHQDARCARLVPFAGPTA